MNGVMANWKTTSAGLVVILTAAAHMLSSGSISGGDISTIFAGIMGIFAKDASTP